MSSILVTGANGQLGSEIQSLASTFTEGQFYFTTKIELDITNSQEVERFVKTKKIHTIINCAAYTAVDLAEDEIELATTINHKAVANLASICKEYSIKLIHVSTDYVFSGASHIPYQEKDATLPQSVYGETKLNGELSLININPSNSVIIRTSWVYSTFGSNFVKTMLRLGKERDQLGIIYDQVGSPTNAKDLARAIITIIPKINNDSVEIYHYTNEGVCSWYDFAKAIFEIKGIHCDVSAIPSSAYPTKAIRPHYSVLNKQKIKDHFSLEIPYWRDSLKECLQKI